MGGLGEFTFRTPSCLKASPGIAASFGDCRRTCLKRSTKVSSPSPITKKSIPSCPVICAFRGKTSGPPATTRRRGSLFLTCSTTNSVRAEFHRYRLTPRMSGDFSVIRSISLWQPLRSQKSGSGISMSTSSRSQQYCAHAFRYPAASGTLRDTLPGCGS